MKVCVSYDLGVSQKKLIAVEGYLSAPWWQKLQQTHSEYKQWHTMLDGVVSAINRDTFGSRSTPLGFVNLSGIQLAKDECDRYLEKYLAKRTLSSWVQTPTGAMQAIRFISLAELAMRLHPVKEFPHKLKRTRCPQCGFLAFVWNPPQTYLDEVLVKCSNETCGFVVDQGSFEVLVQIEEMNK